MDALVTGILYDQSVISEVVQKLSDMGYTNVSVSQPNTETATGPFQGIPVADIPQKLEYYGASEDTANNYFEELEADYALITVAIYQRDADAVKAILASYNAKDIQFIHR